jgi:hypothetical protein
MRRRLTGDASRPSDEVTSRHSSFPALLLPAFDLVPSYFLPNLLRIVQWRSGILPPLDLAAFYIPSNFFLGLLGLIH